MVTKSFNQSQQMQNYVSESSDKLDGKYMVSAWNSIKSCYEPLEYNFKSEEQAKERARLLNEEWQNDYENEHQNELIDKYYDYAISDDIQKQNAARNFFSRFPYQREVCNKILEKLEERI